MTKQTRRSFLKQTPAYVATTGILASVSSLAAACADPKSAQADQSQVDLTTLSPDINTNGPLIAYVRDFAKGEVSVLVDTKEFVFRDHELIQRLLKAGR